MGCDQSTEAGQRWRRTYAMDFNAEGPTHRFDYHTDAEAIETKKNRRIAMTGLSTHDVIIDETAGGSGGGSGGNNAAGGAAADGANGSKEVKDGKSKSKSKSSRRSRKSSRKDRERKSRSRSRRSDSNDDSPYRSDRGRNSSRGYSPSAGSRYSTSSFGPAATSGGAGPYIPESELRALRVIRLSEVATHTTERSAWIVIGGVVYDVTSFLTSHPGGAALVLGACGGDASQAFLRSHGNVGRARDALRRSPLVRRIGRLPPGEGGAAPVRKDEGSDSDSGSERSSFSDDRHRAGVAGSSGMVGRPGPPGVSSWTKYENRKRSK